MELWGLSVVRVLSASRLIPAPRRTAWPSVGVVIATRDRPNLLRRAIASITAEDYPGPVRVVVVYDGAQPDWRIAHGGDRPVLVLENWRTPGSSGARNTGILAVGDCDLVALCNDDDTWHPAKLTAQVRSLRHHPGALFSTCAAEVEYAGRRIPRLTGRCEVWPDDLTRTRAGELSPSGFVAWQNELATSYLRGGIGLLAEDAPGNGSVWDLLLRAARRGPIRHVDVPMVRVLWRTNQRDPRSVAAEVDVLRWMLERHPELGTHNEATARIHAEIACWEAARGQRAEALHAALAAVRSSWRTPWTAFAVAAAAGVVRGRPLLAAVLRRRLP
jgi:glycosyltransferase involved in cell wall biosynthesis